MENIYSLFKTKKEQHTSYQEKNNALMEIEREAIRRLYQSGCDTQTIKAALFKFSPFLREQGSKVDWDKFNQILEEEKAKASPANDLIQQQLTEEKIMGLYGHIDHSKLMKICAETDQKVINELLNDGIPKPEVMEAFKRENSFAGYAASSRAMDLYKLRIENEIDTDRQLQSVDEQEKAQQEFSRQQELLAKKYTDYQEGKYTEYHDGRICTHLLMHCGFSPETVENVLTEQSRYQGEDREEYAKEIVAQCREVKRAYTDIQQFDLAPNNILESVNSARQAYQAFAKDYMLRNNVTELDYVDDLKILAEMSDPYYGIPERYIRKAFAEGSPVAIEPGRDTEEYINSLMSEKSAIQQKTIGNEKAERMFRTEMDRYKQVAARTGGAAAAATITKNYYHNALAIHKLMENHFSQKDILEVLKRRFSEGNSAFIMLDSVNQIFKREKELIAPLSPRMPELRQLKGKKYSELTDSTFGSKLKPLEIFRIALQEHFKLNPSWKIKLLDKALYVLVAETLLTYFPDFDRVAMAEILKNSPYGMISTQNPMKGIENGNSRFGDMLINEAERHVKEYQRFSEQEAAVQKEYSHQCGFAAQGVTAAAENNTLTQYQHGQGAVKMLIKGVPEPDIKMAIIQTVLTNDFSQVSPEQFAEDIIEKSKKTLARREELLNYTPPEQTEQIENAEDFYKAKLHNELLRRGEPKPSMDIDAAKEMILREFEPTVIKESIQKLSPVITQPGRDNSYIEYVILNAQNYINNENTKLNEFTDYKTMPLFSKQEISTLKSQPQQLYEQGTKKLKSIVDLPFSKEFDEIIARNMFAAGIERDDIERVFHDKSPLDNSPQQTAAKDYVTQIVDKVYNELYEDGEIMEEKTAEPEDDVQLEHDEHDYDRGERTLQMTSTNNE